MGKHTPNPIIDDLANRAHRNWVRMYEALHEEGFSHQYLSEAGGFDRIRYYVHRPEGGQRPGLNISIGLVVASGGRFNMNTYMLPLDQPLPERKGR